MAKRILIIGALALGVTLGLGVASYLLSWGFRQSVSAVVSGLSWIELTDDSERVVLVDSPLLVADYYPGDDDQPLIILVHGSSKRGRRSALVRTLAQQLRDAGLPVLAVDLRGFGESEDPILPLRGDLGFEKDVILAAEFALKH